MTLKIDSNGVQIQTLQEILDERQSNLLSVMGEDFTIDKTSPIGNMELANANSEQLIHEVVAYLASQLNSETAEGYFLDCICEYNNIYRFPQSKSTVKYKIIGTKDTNISSGDIRVLDKETGAYWLLNESPTIAEDGTIIASFICEEYGPIENKEGNVLEIKTPISGVTKVESISDNNLVLGRYAETDYELRVRRRQAVQNTGAYSLDNIKSTIFTLDGIIDCKYLENFEETTKNGLPPKSFEIIVDGGSQEEIINVIFDKKTLGVKPFGNTKEVREDSEGNKYEIAYTKAEHINTGLDITISTNGAQTQTWQDLLKQNILDKFNEVQLIGVPVKDYTYYTVLTELSEITDIKSIKLKNLNEEESTGTNIIDINIRQIAKLDVNNINITFDN